MVTSFWSQALVRLSLARPWAVLIAVGLVTLVMTLFAEHLELRMNWTDLLPEHEPIVRSYREVQDRFGEASLVVVLEGSRDDMVAMAAQLVPRLESVEGLYNVQARLPVEFLKHHGFVLMKPDMFKRSLNIFSNPSLVGTFQGLNDDYEREYVDNESNLKRDEVEIARGLLGLTRTLEVLYDNLDGTPDPPPIEEAVEAMTVGEPWLLSLDRSMLLIACTPHASMADEMEPVLASVEEVEAVIEAIAQGYPKVHASLTGMAKIGQDEMNSVGLYTQVLTVGALILIYLLLVRSFRSWLIPVLALIPLAVGIVWTLGLLFLLYGGLNLFTAMIMLILLGLGIDFSIHLIARFRESLARGSDLRGAHLMMLGEAGIGVLTGALTTAMAFLTLMIADTRGIFEFGVAAGVGVLLTLAAIFLALPSLLILHVRHEQKRQGNETAPIPGSSHHRDRGSPRNEHHALNCLGGVARAGWRRPVPALGLVLVLLVLCVMAMREIGFEYDFLELEPAGLRSVELQREIPERFGLADHAAWLVTENIEESRVLKERLRKKPLVGDVVVISDYVPSKARVADYEPYLAVFREKLENQVDFSWNAGDTELLETEINRFWDNLDLMSNVAFTAGLDRIVKVIDQMTGYDTDTNTTDTTAILPRFSRLLGAGLHGEHMDRVAQAWGMGMVTILDGMTDPSPIDLSDLPPDVLRALTPRKGNGYLLLAYPRKNLWNREEMIQFAKQTESVNPGIAGTEQLFLVMMDRTLDEGGKAARLALAVIAVLLLVHFRGPLGLLALVPLATGALFMLGLMYVFGMKYNYMNLIAVPIILGIGIDDGVHALHRFRSEGSSGATRVYDSFRFVGRAILLTSLTTMIGFGSVAFYEMRGMASFGIVLFMGVGACFVATVLVLPPLLRVFHHE